MQLPRFEKSCLLFVIVPYFSIAFTLFYTEHEKRNIRATYTLCSNYSARISSTFCNSYYHQFLKFFLFHLYFWHNRKHRAVIFSQIVLSSICTFIHHITTKLTDLLALSLASRIMYPATSLHGYKTMAFKEET